MTYYHVYGAATNTSSQHGMCGIPSAFGRAGWKQQAVGSDGMPGMRAIKNYAYGSSDVSDMLFAPFCYIHVNVTESTDDFSMTFDNPYMGFGGYAANTSTRTSSWAEIVSTPAQGSLYDYSGNATDSYPIDFVAMDCGFYYSVGTNGTKTAMTTITNTDMARYTKPSTTPDWLTEIRDLPNTPVYYSYIALSYSVHTIYTIPKTNSQQTLCIWAKGRFTRYGDTSDTYGHDPKIKGTGSEQYALLFTITIPAKNTKPSPVVTNRDGYRATSSGTYDIGGTYAKIVAEIAPTNWVKHYSLTRSGGAGSSTIISDTTISAGTTGYVNSLSSLALSADATYTLEVWNDPSVDDNYLNTKTVVYFQIFPGDSPTAIDVIHPTRYGPPMGMGLGQQAEGSDKLSSAFNYNIFHGNMTVDGNLYLKGFFGKNLIVQGYPENDDWTPANTINGTMGHSFIFGWNNTVGSGYTVSTCGFLGTDNTLAGSLTQVLVVGASNTISGSNGLVIGGQHTATMYNNLIVGLRNTGGARYGAIIGGQNTVTSNYGDYSLIAGYGNNVGSHDDVIVLGWSNTVSYNYSVMLGQGLTSSAINQVVVGKYNVALSTDAKFAVGDGSSSAKHTALELNTNSTTTDLAVYGPGAQTKKTILAAKSSDYGVWVENGSATGWAVSFLGSAKSGKLLGAAITSSSLMWKTSVTAEAYITAGDLTTSSTAARTSGANYAVSITGDAKAGYVPVAVVAVTCSNGNQVLRGFDLDGISNGGTPTVKTWWRSMTAISSGTSISYNAQVIYLKYWVTSS